MKPLINKQLYKFTQDKLQKHGQGGQIKNSALAMKLYENYNFGQLDLNNKQLSFSFADVLNLTKEIQTAHGVDIRNDPYPDNKDRLTTAEQHRNEKENSYAVSKNFILINSLSSLKVNQTSHELSGLTSLGSYIKGDEILTVEHSAIVLVENLAVMANLNLLNLSNLDSEIDSSIDLTKALWLYRGDVKSQQTTNSSYQFFRRFKGEVPLICFSDLDPKGIEIALTSHADFWLTLQNANEVDLPLLGGEQEWYKQKTSISYLLNQEAINLENPNEEKHEWQHSFEILKNHKKTLKQEHMLKHKLELRLVNI
ncbi:hypothetical protein [Colwellia psychrerythraea]|uniref:DUF7281 domain-containing protein n=1 Tax=Colwellia psychrerythraea TaxID=28229 RepID=A0A099KT13_COLPS|nr:hypothetical protein [Colwellia psychrerythraea]KGJ93914.1 hypothetical protein GAB14E_2469 [Colwellia psychrerythraea]